MQDISAKHHRRSIRLRGYDYRQAGAYFVTFVCQNRSCLYGHIAETEMQLNAAGQIIESRWTEITNHFPNVSLDEFIVMPNHLHGIILISDDVGAGTCGRPYRSVPRDRKSVV